MIGQPDFGMKEFGVEETSPKMYYVQIIDGNKKLRWSDGIGTHCVSSLVENPP